jgi:hypothetical protein
MRGQPANESTIAYQSGTVLWEVLVSLLSGELCKSFTLGSIKLPQATVSCSEAAELGKSIDRQVCVRAQVNDSVCCFRIVFS